MKPLRLINRFLQIKSDKLCWAGCENIILCVFCFTVKLSVSELYFIC